MKLYHLKADYFYSKDLSFDVIDGNNKHFLFILKEKHEKRKLLAFKVAEIVIDTWPGFKGMSLDELVQALWNKRNYDNELVSWSYIMTIMKNIIKKNPELKDLNHIDDLYWINNNVVSFKGVK